jgi:hypothetical protein
MNAKDFQSDPVRQQELASLLTHPTLQLALGILKDEIEPLPQPATEQSPVISTAKYHQIAGANHIVKGLSRLTLPYKPPVKITGRTLIPEPQTD